MLYASIHAISRIIDSGGNLHTFNYVSLQECFTKSNSFLRFPQNSHQLQTRGTNEGGCRHVRHRFGQHGLPSAWRTIEQHPTGRIDANLRIQFLVRQWQLYCLLDRCFFGWLQDKEEKDENQQNGFFQKKHNTTSHHLCPKGFETDSLFALRVLKRSTKKSLACVAQSPQPTLISCFWMSIPPMSA